MKKFIRKIGVICAVMLVVLFLLETLFTKAYIKDDFYKPQWLYQQVDGAYDFAVLGNSRPYTGVNVEYLEEISGEKGLNLSIANAQFSTMLLMLKIFLERGNTVETLYVNIDSKQITDDEKLSISANKFFPLYKEAVVKEHFGKYGLKYKMYGYVPFVRYAEYNFNWGLHQYINTKHAVFKNKFDASGTKHYASSNYVGSKVPVECPLDEINSEEFDELLELCLQNNIKIKAFTMPYASIIADESFLEGEEKLDLYFRNKHIEFHSYATKWNEDFDYFKDPLHLNDKGSKRFTSFLFDSYFEKESK